MNRDQLSTDLLEGLTSDPKRIPSKYFYDQKGSDLFDRICETAEYYPTRTEARLLDQAAPDIARTTASGELVELGSGSARKTGALLRAMNRCVGRVSYMPMDISEDALDAASSRVRGEFPDVEIKAVVCDYTRGMNGVRIGANGIVAFLGSTIGNFRDFEVDRLLTSLHGAYTAGGWILVGADLVKPESILDAAYNDSEGLTEAFNRNILDVVNDIAVANFDPESFDHLAFFHEAESRVEMHLVARHDMAIHLGAHDRIIQVRSGERILTEISRKFTRRSVDELLSRNGFEPVHWYTDEPAWMGMALARREAD